MAPTQSHFSANDGVLVISLLYLSIDMQYEWHEFVMCHWPIHRWLLVSYGMIILFRLMHILGSMHAAADTGDFLLNLRHKGALPRMLMSLTWLCVLPFFTVWTAIGAYWLWDSRRREAMCLPAGMSFYFIITWQVLSAAWVIIHASLGLLAWLMERRLRIAEGNLREIEDADVVARWGQVSQLSGYTALISSAQAGLTPLEISSLPHTMATTSSEIHESECSICLLEINKGDKVRRLGNCGHTFHRSCIDLWLLRRADCPLCKRDVRGKDDEVLAAGEVNV